MMHPDAEDLLWELTRLSFSTVRIAGDFAPLGDGSERLFRRFKGIHEVYGVWYAPDDEAHDQLCGVPGARHAATQALQKFRRYSGATTAVYAMLQNADQLEPYLNAFRQGGWHPHFRCCGTDAAMKILGQRLHHVADEGVQCQIGSQLPKSIGPVLVQRHAIRWQHGVPECPLIESNRPSFRDKHAQSSCRLSASGAEYFGECTSNTNAGAGGDCQSTETLGSVGYGMQFEVFVLFGYRHPSERLSPSRGNQTRDSCAVARNSVRGKSFCLGARQRCIHSM